MIPRTGVLTPAERDTIMTRIGYLRGIIHGIILYAHWEGGEQFCGDGHVPLHAAVKEYKNELNKLSRDLSKLDKLTIVNTEE